jgi:hypothetical protein
MARPAAALEPRPVQPPVSEVAPGSLASALPLPQAPTQRDDTDPGANQTPTASYTDAYNTQGFLRKLGQASETVFGVIVEPRCGCPYRGLVTLLRVDT